MRALLATLAALSLGAPASAPAPQPSEIRWVVGPGSVALAEGRGRCALPPGVALAADADARSVFEGIAGGADGSELAVVSPVAPDRRWFAVLSWWSGGAQGPTTVTGTASDGQRVLNRSVVVRLKSGAVLATLVAPVAEASEAGALFDRVVGGLRSGGDPRAPRAQR